MIITNLNWARIAAKEVAKAINMELSFAERRTYDFNEEDYYVIQRAIELNCPFKKDTAYEELRIVDPQGCIHSETFAICKTCGIIKR